MKKLQKLQALTPCRADFDIFGNVEMKHCSILYGKKGAVFSDCDNGKKIGKFMKKLAKYACFCDFNNLLDRNYSILCGTHEAEFSIFFVSDEAYSTFCGSGETYSTFCGLGETYSTFYGLDEAYSTFCGSGETYSTFCGSGETYSTFYGLDGVCSIFCGTDVAFCGVDAEDSLYCGENAAEYSIFFGINTYEFLGVRV